MEQPGRTIGELLRAFEEFNQRFVQLREALSRPDADPIQVLLFGMQKIVVTYYLAFRAVVWDRSPAQIDQVFEGSNLSPSEARNVMEDGWRLGMISVVHFRLDALFHLLIRALNPSAKTRFFGERKRELLRLLGLTGNKIVENPIDALTHIRNSMHNNGMHRNVSVLVRLRGLTFEFNKDQAVQCADWEHLIGALHALCDGLELILLSDKLSALKSELRDDFIEEVAAGRAQE